MNIGQQFGKYMLVEYICWFWIYQSWVVSVCPTGAYICQNISLCWIYAANNFGSICKLDIYVGVGYSLLEIIVGAFRGTFSKIWIYAANNLGGKCCY